MGPKIIAVRGQFIGNREKVVMAELICSTFRDSGKNLPVFSALPGSVEIMNYPNDNRKHRTPN
jgi:hypothetical protein